ncbi:MAG TPA: hypothetical protein VMI75_24940 [Polyangiaceae bacterium]|nr:hypothetical protein [Polyangiaceae bacterium]
MRATRSIFWIVLAAGVLAASPALAQDSGNQRNVKQQSGVLQVGEITIVGRVQKPIAAVDVAKIQPKLTLAELRQPFLDRIEEAVKKDPF